MDKVKNCHKRVHWLLTLLLQQFPIFPQLHVSPLKKATAIMQYTQESVYPSFYTMSCHIMTAETAVTISLQYCCPYVCDKS